MRTLADIPVRPGSVRSALAILAAWCVCACATPGPERPKQTEVRDATGFTITEEVRASRSARGDFEEAVELLDQEQYEAGIALLVAVTESAPQVTTAHIDLGMAYSRVGDLEHATASLERALELSPRHPVAHNELGIVHRKSGRFEEARQSYQKALEVYPDFHFARKNLAILCDLFLLDTTCAVKQYELYTQSVPGDEDAAMWIADLRNRTGE